MASLSFESKLKRKLKENHSCKSTVLKIKILLVVVS